MELLRNIEKGDTYEVIVSWKEIPIKVKLKVRWVSPQERFISFEFKDCRFKSIFSADKEVYVKLGDVYLLTEVFSNLRDELVLEVESITPPPPIVMREFVRVQTSEKEPVYVIFYLDEENTLLVKATDISEMGVGVLIDKGQVERLLSSLDVPQEGSSALIHRSLPLLIEMPDGYKLKAEGELRNIITQEGATYVRLGFSIRLPERDLKHIRAYVMRRQKEMIEHLNML